MARQMDHYWTDEERARFSARIDADRASRGHPPEIDVALPYEIAASLTAKLLEDDAPSCEAGGVMSALDRRLAQLIAADTEFTADDLTDSGTITLDAAHGPNGKQNGIGAFISQAASRGLIEFTGRIERSKAPHRKGGAIRVWRATASGRSWSRGVTS